MTPKQIIPALGFALLSACGGGGGGTGGGGGGGGGASYTLLFDTTATGISGITVLSEDGSAANDLDHDTGDIVLGGLDGTYNPATKTVTFDGGGTAVLLDTGTEYVAIFEADPVGEDPFSGTLISSREASCALLRARKWCIDVDPVFWAPICTMTRLGELVDVISLPP